MRLMGWILRWPLVAMQPAAGATIPAQPQVAQGEAQPPKKRKRSILAFLWAFPAGVLGAATFAFLIQLMLEGNIPTLTAPTVGAVTATMIPGIRGVVLAIMVLFALILLIFWRQQTVAIGSQGGKWLSQVAAGIFKRKEAGIGVASYLLLLAAFALLWPEEWQWYLEHTTLFWVSHVAIILGAVLWFLSGESKLAKVAVLVLGMVVVGALGRDLYKYQVEQDTLVAPEKRLARRPTLIIPSGVAGTWEGSVGTDWVPVFCPPSGVWFRAYRFDPTVGFTYWLKTPEGEMHQRRIEPGPNQLRVNGEINVQCMTFKADAPVIVRVELRGS